MTIQSAKVTLSVPKNLISLADEIAKEKRISRSKLVTDCLQELVEGHLRAQMEHGYKAMAEEQQQFAKMSFELQRSIVPKW